jgi:hypothetical protein
MSPLFGKKQYVFALAELLEDGRALTNQELGKIKYRQYSGAEPTVEILVRVDPESEPPFESKMKAGISKSIVLKPGVRVRVKYEPDKKKQVILDEDTQAILERNPQLIKTGK